MFIEQLTDNEIREITYNLVNGYNLRKHQASCDHIFEINKNNNDEYKITIARYETFNQYKRIEEESCYLSDFNFISEYAFLEQKNVTIEYNVYMYRKFGEKYLNELKIYLDKQRVKKVSSLKKELEEEDIKIIDELTR